MPAPFFVSRQRYWGVEPNRRNVVEIVSGGCDYANPDMLSPKYRGEAREYDDPRDAVRTALEIRDAWRANAPELEILIVAGSTGGFTAPLSDDDDCVMDEKALWEWAEKAYEALPKCDECGGLIRGNPFYLVDFVGEYRFCSERCADKAHSKLADENWELAEEAT
jgi:hypothetical protein